MVATLTYSHDLVTALSSRGSGSILTAPSSIDQQHRIITTEAFPEATRRLNEFAMLPPSWDTYDAKPIAATAIHEARQLLAAVARRFANQTDRATPFFLAPLSYGGIQIEWRRPNKEIEVEIGPDGRFGYLRITGEGENRTFEERDYISADQILECVVRLCDGN